MSTIKIAVLLESTMNSTMPLEGTMRRSYKPSLARKPVTLSLIKNGGHCSQVLFAKHMHWTFVVKQLHGYVIHLLVIRSNTIGESIEMVHMKEKFEQINQTSSVMGEADSTG